MKHIAAILAIALLSACATLSEEECAAGNWRAIGYEDGAEGQPATRIGDHRHACERFGVSPDLALWRAGYEEGLPAYCTRENGYRVGARGETYHGVCQGALAAAFYPAFQDGSTVHALSTELESARSDLYALTLEIDQLREARDRARENAEFDGLPAAERDSYLDEVERLSEEIGERTQDERDFEFLIQDLQNDLWDLEAEMRRYYPEGSDL